MNDFLIIDGSNSKFDKEFYLEGLADLLRAGDLTSFVVDLSEVSVSNLCEAKGFILYSTKFNDRLKRFIEAGKRFNKSFFVLTDRNDTELCGIPKTLLSGVIYLDEEGNSKTEMSIPYTVSERILGRLKHTRHYSERRALYLDVTNDFFKENAGLINDFLDQFGDRRVYTFQKVDEDLLSTNNRVKLIYLDPENPNHLIRVINRTMLAIIGEPDSVLESYMKKLHHINKTPVIDQNDPQIEKYLKGVTKGRKVFSDSKIFKSAYEIVHKYGAVYNAEKLNPKITTLLSPSVAINIPGGQISGGILVSIKHAQILQKRGYEVTMISDDKMDHKRFFEIEDDLIPGVSRKARFISANFDKLVATLWITYYFVAKYRNAKEKFYLIQGFETDFTDYGHGYRVRANRTYFDDEIQYLTISPWIRQWLTEKYGRKGVKYAPNGLNLDLFQFKEREFNGKFKIMIEGNPQEPYRGVDEAFRIAQGLDRDLFDITFISNRKATKDWYDPDRSYYATPHDEMSGRFQNCDLLLKCSILESFSYPPLEMMATGGTCVIADNEGNRAYAKDGVNCFVYSAGDIEAAREKIMKLREDKELYRAMVTEGLKTVQDYSWDKIEDQIAALYE